MSKRRFGKLKFERVRPAKRVKVARRMTPFGENKFVDLASSTFACNTTGSITLIPVIVQGVGESQRVGRKVRLTSMEFRGTVKSDATTTSTQARILVVWDKQPNGGLAAITDVLNTANSRSFNNDSNRDRFVTLYNKSYVLNGNSTTTGEQSGTTGFVADFFRKMSRTMVFGTDDDGTISDIRTGALLLVTVGDAAAGTTDANLLGGFRIRYQDL